MYSIFIECDFSILFEQVFVENIRHVDTVIQRGLKNALPHRQGYT